MSLDFVSITKVSVIGRYPNHVNFTMAVRDTKLKICPVLIVDLKIFVSNLNISNCQMVRASHPPRYHYIGATH